jgi:hypothetical protein
VSSVIVFSATFVTVFALGLQSRIVNQGQYIAAAIVSAMISTGSLFLYEILARPTGWDRIGYYLGGIIGITCSIYFHKRAEAWLRLQIARWQARRATGESLIDALLGRRQLAPAEVSRRPDEHSQVDELGDVGPCRRCGRAAFLGPCERYGTTCELLHTDIH